MKLGSLFDGSGGFPLAGMMAGITPVWSSEIELYPLRVTAARFPDVKQLGSVTEINGGEIEPVDVITFGSPCQDLSVAGKQLGIHDGKRSNLFFEAIRIIKEMREADVRAGRSGVDIRPRYAVWENVPGAFSSNKGADFKAVLEALAGVVQEGVAIPQPEKWNTGGGIVGDGWSIAWRVYDAQYWGVPQRRKRIYLVADFGAECAPEILFKCESQRGDSAQSGAAREGTASDVERSAGGSDRVRCLNPWDCQSKRQHDISGAYSTLSAYNGGGGRCEWVCYALEGNTVDRDSKKNGKGWCEAVSPTLNTQDRHCLIFQNPIVYDARGNGNGDTCPTLTGDHQRRITDFTALCIGNGQLNQISMAEQANTLDCMHDQQAVITDGRSARKYIVRRLTPLECSRLQGFPDWWMDGVEGSDSAKYKMWGNGIALPCAFDVLIRIAKGLQQCT